MVGAYTEAWATGGGGPQPRGGWSLSPGDCDTTPGECDRSLGHSGVLPGSL